MGKHDNILHVRLYFDDQTTYFTTTTKTAEEAKSYYQNKRFIFGKGQNEQLKKCINIEVYK